MEKMTWTRPVAVVEQFMPNEYIAACEDTTKQYYKFICDAGVPEAYHSVYLEDNGESGLQRYSWGDSIFADYDTHRSSTYHPCGIEHYAEVGRTTFYDGYLILPNGTVKNVLVWKDVNNDNTHCTYALNSEIEIVKGNKS